MTKMNTLYPKIDTNIVNGGNFFSKSFQALNFCDFKET